MAKRDYLDGLLEISEDIKKIRRGALERRSGEGVSPAIASPEIASPEEVSPEGISSESRSPEVVSPERRSPERTSPAPPSPERVSPEGASPEYRSPEPRSPEASSPEIASPAAASSPRVVTDGPRDIRSNFIKVDLGVLDVALGELGPVTGIVYLRLYRLSYGWRVNTCRVTTQALADACGITDRTAQTAMNKLIAGGYIERELDFRKTAGGNLYRVFLPSEIAGLAEKCQRRISGSSAEFSPEGTSPETPSPEDNARTREFSSPELSAGDMSNALVAATSSSPEPSSPEESAGTIDNGTSTIENNNIDGDHPVVVLLREAGFDIRSETIARWIADGIPIERLRECISYVKGRKWGNANGALIAAIQNGWSVSKKESKAETADRIAQVDFEERERLENEAWVKNRLAGMTPEERQAWEAKAAAECEHDRGYREVPPVLRKHYVQAYLHLMLLAAR